VLAKARLDAREDHAHKVGAEKTKIRNLRTYGRAAVAL
jgi:hypothetical protein